MATQYHSDQYALGAATFRTAAGTLCGNIQAASQTLNAAPTASTLTAVNTKTFTGTIQQLVLPAVLPAANGGGITLTGLNLAQGAITNAADSEAITVKQIVITGAAGVALETGAYTWTGIDITTPNQAANSAANAGVGIKITGGTAAGGATAYQRGIDITMAADTQAAIRVATGAIIVGHTALIVGSLGNRELGLHQVGEESGIECYSWSVGTNDSPVFDLCKSKGATIGDYTVLTTAYRMGAIVFRGSDGTGFVESVIISAYPTGTIGTNRIPGLLKFRMFPDDDTALPMDVLILTATTITIGDNAQTYALAAGADHIAVNILPSLSRITSAFTGQLHGIKLTPTINATNSQSWTDAVGIRGIEVNPTILASATGTVTGIYNYRSQATIGAMTVTNLYHYVIDDATGAGTVTNQYGLYIFDLTKGATLNYPIYSAGGKSYHAGHFGFGVLPSASIGIYYAETVTITDNVSQIGIRATPTYQKTSAAYTGIGFGLFSEVDLGAANTQNWTNAQGVIGVYSEVATITGFTGTVTGAIAFKGISSVAAGTVTSLWDFYGADSSGAGTVTNLYIFYAEAPTKGGTLNYSYYAAGGNWGMLGAPDMIVAANTAATLEISDATNKLMAFDSRTATDNIIAVVFSSAPATFAAAAGSTYSQMSIAAKTLTLTGTTGVTAMHGLQLYLGAPTITNVSAGLAIGIASTLYIAAPIATGNASITNNRMITTVVADCYLTAAGVWTDTASTAKVKRNIREFDLSQTVPYLLDQLHPKTYQYNEHFGNDFDRQRYGCVAEELPDFLRVPGEMNPSALNALVIANFALVGVKYIESEVDRLKARVAELEKQLKEN